MPFIGPRVDKCTSAARRKRGPDLPIQARRLRFFAVSLAVQANFGDQQRAIPCQILQTRQICLVIVLRFQENVETNKIEERQVQVFRRRKVRVRNERTGGHFLHIIVQVLQETFDGAGSMPAHDGCRNFVR